jgi:hypothetical protein
MKSDNYPSQPADPPGKVQCIICDVEADLVPRPGWSVLVAPDGWGHVTGLPGSRCPACMARHNAQPITA